MGKSKICGQNALKLAKWLIIAEIFWHILGLIYPLAKGHYRVLFDLLYLAILGVVYYGIEKKNKSLIIFGIVVNILVTMFWFSVMIAFFVVKIPPELIKDFRDDEKNARY